MSTADELRELREAAWKLFGVTFEREVVGDSYAATVLIQAQALHRLADAFAPLERIAGAMEANRARGEEPAETRQAEARQFAGEQLEDLTRATTPDPLPIRIGKGWVHGYTPASTGLRHLEEVKVYDPSIPEGWKWTQACEVGDQDLWAPAHVNSSPLFRELTLRRRPTTTPDESEAAMEIREAAAFGLCDPQEPPQTPSPTPGGHPLDQGGWIRSRVPTEGDGDEDGDVRVLRRDGKGSHWCHYSTVVLGQPWVRGNVRDPSSAPAPLPAHIACPTSEGWIHDRVPGPEDGDPEGDVWVPMSFIHWSQVVPGQPWRPLCTTAP